MLSRRRVLHRLLTAGAALTVPSFAVPVLPSVSGRAVAAEPEADWPLLLSSARGPDGKDYAVGWHPEGGILWRQPLPARAHGPALSPDGRVAAFPGRRPGSTVLLVDPEDGRRLALWQAPEDRSFQGHAAFTADGRLLYTTEVRADASAADGETGVLGVWDVASGHRLGEVSTHGIEPHEIRRMADGVTLVVANGGILTSPETRRVKLNLGAMDTSLVYLDSRDGRLLEQVRPPESLQRVSLRHLAETPDGAMLVAGQYQGNPADAVPLLARHRRGEALSWVPVPGETVAALKQYCGSIGALADGRFVVTSPPGGLALHGQADGSGETRQIARPDVCGLAVDGARVLLTTGFGEVLTLSPQGQVDLLARETVQWDNHALFA
ncbi:DUF1513 domain-containing protein [Novispirillum itersonii]|uniref:DUF1513 domain-containing protein n=1 Tax=Novispirillum itersonii TaxID=189 RepID=UPI000376E73B|nr:DUF1513 domain-containing protein [Novispirillum itersonii]